MALGDEGVLGRVCGRQEGHGGIFIAKELTYFIRLFVNVLCISMVTFKADEFRNTGVTSPLTV